MCSKSRNLFLLALAFLIISCGSGDSTIRFQSVDGRWNIETQQLTSVECPFRTGGFADSIDIVTSGDTVYGTSGVRGTQSWVGHLTDDGFVIESELGSLCAGEAEAPGKITIVVSGISDFSAQDEGVASYSYENSCADGSQQCTVTAEGDAAHVTQR